MNNSLLRSYIIIKTLVFSIWHFILGNHQSLINQIYSGGAVCIKLAQWLSQRPDVIGNDCQKIMKKLCYQVPPHSFCYTQQIIKKHKLGQKITHLNQKPLGSGSIAQVYKAKYNNKTCIIKVQHPGVTQEMMTDIQIFKKFCKILEFFGFKIFKTLALESTLDNILTQCDFINESRNTRHFQECFLTNKNINFPEIFFESSDLLIESYLSGSHMDQFCQKYPELAVKAKTISLAAYLQMFLVNGLIHADCHYGNIKYRFNPKTKNLKVNFLDCGVATHLDNKKKNHIINLMNQMISNPQDLADTLVQLSTTDIDLNKFNILLDSKLDILQKNKRSGQKTHVSNLIQMLIQLLSDVGACIDADIITFLIGYCLIEGENVGQQKINLTKRAIELISNDDAFETTRKSARKLETAINCMFRL